MLRVLATHQCGPGLIPGPGVMWVEFLVGSLLPLRDFSPGTLVFPFPQKPTFLNSSSIRNPRATGLLFARLLSATLVKQSRLIFFYLRSRLISWANKGIKTISMILD